MNNQSEFPRAMDLTTEELIQAAVENKEGVIASNGAFSPSSGDRSG